MNVSKSILKQISIKGIKVYQRTVSPFLPKSCRFYPSCSMYAIESIEKYGLWKGGFRAIGRLFKCHPWHKGGFDTVD